MVHCLDALRSSTSLSMVQSSHVYLGKPLSRHSSSTFDTSLNMSAVAVAPRRTLLAASLVPVATSAFTRPVPQVGSPSHTASPLSQHAFPPSKHTLNLRQLLSDEIPQAWYSNATRLIMCRCLMLQIVASQTRVCPTFEHIAQDLPIQFKQLANNGGKILLTHKKPCLAISSPSFITTPKIRAGNKL